MINLRFDELAKTTGGNLLTTHRAEDTFAGVAIDSRTLKSGQLFFAIRGEKNDGHQFVDQAVARGAAGIVAESAFFNEHPLPVDSAVVGVSNTHAAMLRLAEKYLETIDVQRVGITGSNGKTTTKEIAYSLLRVVEKGIYRSPGNYNNLYGIPLALFEMPQDTRVAVLEMAISVPGEMDRLASLVKPHLMVVTNVGPTHLEYLGSVEKVATEKLRALLYTQAEAPLIVNADDPILMAEARRVCVKPITFGQKNKATFRPDAVERKNDGTTVVSIEGNRFVMPLFGDYQIYNLLAAYAVARTLGYSFSDMDTESISFSTAAMRGQVINTGGIVFVSDCYNANPESVRAGLESFARYQSNNRRLIVLGDMLELGDEAARFHREIGELLADQDFFLTVAVGSQSNYIIEGALQAGVPAEKLRHYDDVSSCVEELVDILQPGDLVYLKGSRGIRLEAILERFSDTEERH